VSEYLNLKTQNDAAIENARLKSVLFAATDSISITKLEKQRNTTLRHCGF
jgi:rod shape-determining protein MreC